MTPRKDRGWGTLWNAALHIIQMIEMQEAAAKATRPKKASKTR